MVKGCLLVPRKTSPTDVSSASLSDDDSAENEALVASSLKAEGAEGVKIAKVAKV